MTVVPDSNNNVSETRTATVPLEEDSLKLYRREIGAVALLDGRSEEVMLSTAMAAAKAPDASVQIIEDGWQARQKFITANLRLVDYLARRYVWSGMPINDLLQEGARGLIRAVEKFNPEKGFKFSVYATAAIRNAMGRGVAYHAHIVRLPSEVSQEVSALKRTERRLQLELGREQVTPAELSDELKWPLKKLHDIKKVVFLIEPFSINTLIESDESEWGDFLDDPEGETGYESTEQQELNQAFIRTLKRVLSDELELFVVAVKFGLVDDKPRTDKEIIQLVAKRFPERASLTRNTMHTLIKSALNKLRHPVAYQYLSQALTEDMANSQLWKEAAACRGSNPELMTEALPRGGNIATNLPKLKGLEACAHCVVRTECLNYGQEIKATQGVWGGKVFTTLTHRTDRRGKVLNLE